MNVYQNMGGARRSLPEWPRPASSAQASLQARGSQCDALCGHCSPEDEHLLRAGMVPGPSANGARSRVYSTSITIGTVVDISQFPRPLATDPELAGPVTISNQAFDIPSINYDVNVPCRYPQMNYHLPLSRRGETASGAEDPPGTSSSYRQPGGSEAPWRNFSKTLLTTQWLHARPRSRGGTFLFESGLVDCSPDRQVVAGSEDRTFPPSIGPTRSGVDADYPRW